MNREIRYVFEPSSPLFVIFIHTFIMFVYDITVIKEIREHKELANTLSQFRWFNRTNGFPLIKSLLCFKYWGITPSLNIMGTIAAIANYIILSYLLFFLAYGFLYKV